MGMAETMKRETGMVAPERSEGERSETSRSGGATIPAPAPVRGGPGRSAADPEVISKAVRRQFAAAYKRRVLEEADQSDPGGIAALLRREGLYSSHLNTWRRQRATGEIAGLEPRKRGKKPLPRNPLAGECEQLKRENARLQKRLKQAETIIDVQKKLCEMLGLPVATTDSNGSDE
jgi:transposase